MCIHIILGYLGPLKQRQEFEDAEETERKKRDNMMKEEGRQEERNKQYLNLEGMDVGDENYLPSFPLIFPMMDKITGAGTSVPLNMPISEGDGTRENAPSQMPTNQNFTKSNAFTVVGDLLAEHPHRRSSTPLASVMSAVDSEVKGAEELFTHMKNLKSYLQKRMQHIDNIAQGKGEKNQNQGYRIQPSMFYYARSGQEISPIVEVETEGTYGQHIDVKHPTLQATSREIGSDLDVALKAMNLRLIAQKEATTLMVGTGNVIDKLTSEHGNGSINGINSSEEETDKGQKKNEYIANSTPSTTSNVDSAWNNKSAKMAVTDSTKVVGNVQNTDESYMIAAASLYTSKNDDPKTDSAEMIVQDSPQKDYKIEKNCEEYVITATTFSTKRADDLHNTQFPQSSPTPITDTTKVKEKVKVEEAVEVLSPSSSSKERRSPTSINKTFSLSTDAAAAEKLFDVVLGNVDENTSKGGLDHFIPPTLVEAMNFHERFLRDTSIPVYGGILGGQRYQPADYCLPERSSSQHMHSAAMLSMAPSAPSVSYASHLQGFEMMNRLNQTMSSLCEQKQISLRDEFQYPDYCRPPEGQSNDIHRSQMLLQNFSGLATHVLPRKGDHQDILSSKIFPAAQLSVETSALQPHNSIKDREKFLRNMKKLRSNINTMPIY